MNNYEELTERELDLVIEAALAENDDMIEVIKMRIKD